MLLREGRCFKCRNVGHLCKDCPRARTQIPLANEPTGAVVGEKLCARPTSKLCSPEPVFLRGAWSDRDTNDIFAHCSLIFYYLDFKFSNFVCPSELHPLIWFFLKNSFRKKKNIRKTSQNALAPSIFIVWSIVLKLGTPLQNIQAQNTLLQNF